MGPVCRAVTFPGELQVTTAFRRLLAPGYRKNFLTVAACDVT